MPRPFNNFQFRDFAGLNTGVPAEATPGQASVLKNLYKQKEALQRRKGSARLGNLTPAQAHDGLAWYKIGSTAYLIAAHNGSLVDWLAATPGTTLTGGSGVLTSGVDANAAWLDAVVYWGDGVLQNKRHNGTNVAQVLTDAPLTAPTVAVGAATGPTGTFNYYTTFLSADSHHSAVGSKSAGVTVTDQKINLTAIPTCPAGQGCIGRALWRNKDGTPDYFLVTTINDNTTTTYTDGMLDAALVDPLTDILGVNLQNVRFPPCRLLITHQSRLVGAFCTTSEGDKHTIYLSNYREPWYCPILPDLEEPTQGSRFPLQGIGAGEVTGLASHGSQVFVFTADAAWTLTATEQLQDYTLHRFSNHGCVAHRTVQSVKDMIIWASTDGIYAVREGQPAMRISDDVKETYQAISAADLAKAHAVTWDDKYFFIWPSGCLVYDLRFNLWTENTAWTWRVAVVTATGAAVERLYGAEASAAAVRQLETGTTDEGAAITATWASSDLDLGAPHVEKRLYRVTAYFKTATGTATVRLYRDAGTTAAQTATHDLATVDQAGATVSVLRLDCAEQLRAERFRLEVEYNGSATNFELLGLAVEFRVV